MKIIQIMCANPDCANFGKYSQIDLFNFVWDINYMGGNSPGNLFFNLPSEIHCQNCLTLCISEVKEIN